MKPTLKDIVKEELHKLLSASFIYPFSDSKWVSPLIIIPKKNGKWKLCVDYWELNQATLKYLFPLLFIEQVFDTYIYSLFFLSNKCLTHWQGIHFSSSFMGSTVISKFNLPLKIKRKQPLPIHGDLHLLSTPIGLYNAPTTF